MFDYTQKVTLDTFNYIKKLLFISDLLIQIFNIVYLIYKLVFNKGFLTTNIIFLILFVFYLIYSICTKKEFYTNEEKKNKRLIKYIVKVLKRVTSLCVIILSIIQLSDKTIENTSINILLTGLLIVGFIFNIILDIINKIIDMRIDLFNNAINADLLDIKNNIDNMIFPLNKFSALVKPTYTVNEKEMEKLKNIKYKYEVKKRKKIDFIKKG